MNYLISRKSSSLKRFYSAYMIDNVIYGILNGICYTIPFSIFYTIDQRYKRIEVVNTINKLNEDLIKKIVKLENMNQQYNITLDYTSKKLNNMIEREEKKKDKYLIDLIAKLQHPSSVTLNNNKVQKGEKELK